MATKTVLACEECEGSTFYITTGGAVYCNTCDDGSGDFGLMVGYRAVGHLIEPPRRRKR